MEFRHKKTQNHPSEVCSRKGATYTFLENFKKSLFRGSAQKCAENAPPRKTPESRFFGVGGGNSGTYAKEPLKCLRKRQNEGVHPCSWELPE